MLGVRGGIGRQQGGRQVVERAQAQAAAEEEDEDEEEGGDLLVGGGIDSDGDVDLIAGRVDGGDASSDTISVGDHEEWRATASASAADETHAKNSRENVANLENLY